MPASPNPLRRNEASRRAILDAALQLSAEHGYGRLTIEAVAARAGVSKKTIYRWWSSKGAVVLDAIDDMAAVADYPDTGSLAADLHTQLTAVIDLLTSPENSAVTGLIAEALQDRELAHDLRERLIRPRITTFKSRLRKAQLEGQLAPDADLDVALDLIYGPVYHRLVFHLGMPDPQQLETLIDHALRAFDPPQSTR
ncbi:AcrR family transcriptional regulator [Streptomyces achromogenes]|uniref:AcrR family transcriptional regulator n=1 Tax=Streptomyces achromogenes TaxID=67255 RepID=A0ABU0QDI6_STRAH|nr:TetR/AcrR family transcriptional regulator [Streptomyces achromogenes]MDQ0688713.1 AcrR family transcriptional regulator [Streptomyces achromogenes]MDQ0835906.1 AcrR family transcriptional regulator [Streptomyces achromogenes]